MFMFWIRPYDYIPLDRHTRDYLKSSGIEIMSEKDLDWNSYSTLLNKVKIMTQNQEY